MYLVRKNVARFERQNPACCNILNRYILIVGGSILFEGKACEFYDVEKDTSAGTGDLNVGRHYHSVLFIKNTYVYCFGGKGWRNSGSINSFEMMEYQ